MTAKPAKTDEFRAGYEFGYGDGQVGEYQPEKHHAAHAAPDRVDVLDALERTYWNLRRMSAQHPVRDLAETFAEAESVLKAAERMNA